MKQMKGELLLSVKNYFEALDTSVISKDRREVLQVLIDFAKSKLEKEETIILNYVCTHNSRRSQISQIMGQVASYHYGVDVICYSGGTEETAFHPNAIAAMSRTGLEIKQRGDSNPVIFVRYSNDCPPLSCFSKVYDHAYNNANDFAAIMTCAHADDKCPVILNATRIPIRYEDPKRSDSTKEMSAVYDATAKEIATEMKYVFQKIGNE
ncbi:MAG: protein-tyrosine-phosphatase [Saprospiraceae bacterium]